jgi:hypothetical protein
MEFIIHVLHYSVTAMLLISAYYRYWRKLP